MIWSVVSELIAPFWPYVAGAGALVVGWFVAKRQGAQGQKAKQATKDAKAHQKTIEEVLRETPSDDPADDIRRRMSARARKP